MVSTPSPKTPMAARERSSEDFVPVTFYPVATQRVVEENIRKVRQKPYAHFLDTTMVLRRDVLPALKAPIDIQDALTTSPDSLNRLLEPGYLPGETGYCGLADGTGYASSLTRFPGCTPAMFRWWFWWHSFEAERYALWFPWNHVSTRREDGWKETAAGLTDEERYIGSTHIISEYVGPDCSDILIEFRDPKDFGFDTARFAEAGIVGHACGNVWLQRPRLRAATMVHLIRQTPEGFELRSRYWIADKLRLKAGPLELSIDPLLGALGMKHKIAGERMAYEQLLHDQIEFTHLASFLADLYAEFGPRPKGQ